MGAVSIVVIAWIAWPVEERRPALPRRPASPVAHEPVPAAEAPPGPCGHPFVPADIGRAWTWLTTTRALDGRILGTLTQATTVEEITVRAGTFQALRIEGHDDSRSTIPSADERRATTLWLAQGIGLVRSVTEGRTTRQELELQEWRL